MNTLCRLILIATVALFGLCCYVLSVRFGNVVAFVVIFGGLAWAVKRRRGTFTAYGTARWAGQSDVRRAGMTKGTGLIIGTLHDSERPSRLLATLGLINPFKSSSRASSDSLRSIFPSISGNPPLVRLSSAVHTAVFAPTGVGKGVSCAIPFLRDCAESCVVTDHNGQLATATFRHRQKMGHRVVMVDPFHIVTDHPDALNPIDFIRKDSPHALDEIRDLAEALVIRAPQEREPHWADSAETWIAASTATVVEYGQPDDRSLQTVRRLVASSPETRESMIRSLCQSESFDGLLSRLGHQLTHFVDKELGSTLTTTSRFLKFLDTPAVAASTSSSTFDPNRLTKEKMTVYLVLPPEHARAQSSLLRMWIGALLRGILRGGLQERNRVHFLLDEAATLGHLPQLDDAVDKFRAYGARLIFMYQSIGQLKKCFPEGQDQTFLSNVTQVFFGAAEPQTCEYISSRLGEKTILINSGSTSQGGSRQFSDTHLGGSYSHSWNSNSNWQQIARKILQPAEVGNLSPRTAITFAPGVRPICTRLIRYYEGRPGSFLRQQLQGFKSSIYAFAMFAAMFFATNVSATIQIQPRPMQPNNVPVVPDNRLQHRRDRYAY